MTIVRQENRRTRLPVVFCVIIVATALIILFKSFHIYTSFFIIPRTFNSSSIILNDTSKTKELAKLTDTVRLVVNRSRCTIILRQKSGGRLGNRMFIFASAYGLARTHQCQLYIDQHFLTELLGSFQIKIPYLLTQPEIDSLKGVVQRSSICAFYPDLLKPDAIQYLDLVGYWQTYGYFIKFKDEIHQQFRFQPSILKTAATYFQWWKSLANACCYGHCSFLLHETRKCSKRRKIQSSLSAYHITTSSLKRALFMTNYTWIGIHVRRIDFYKGSVSDDAYILKAMQYFSQKYHNTIFIIASDDKKYCEQKFSEKKNVIVTPTHFSPSEDMAILSLCQHSIVTAGTFGWWSAFLAGGDVMHDNRYMQKKSEICDCDANMYFPPWFLFP